MVFSPGSMKPYQRKVQSCKKANGDVGEQGGNRCEDLKERDVDLTNRFLAETGIPQGSPISPVLFLFFNAPLIEECSATNLRLQVGGFVDDVHLLAYGESTEGNCRTLKAAHEICLRWASTHGASFAPQKYELVHLTRSPKKFNMKATVDLGTTSTRPKASIRVLGLHIDGKLRWGPHMREVKAKMIPQCRALSMTAASTWGATLNKARQVYSVVVRPAMTYAAAAWHTPKGLQGAHETYVKQLEVVQNGCLRRVLGAFKATSTRVLEAESEIAPIQLTLDEAVLRSQATRGTHPVTKAGNAHIRSKLRTMRLRNRRVDNRGRPIKEKEAGETPAEEKEAWALRMLRMDNWRRLTKPDQSRDVVWARCLIKEWKDKRWEALWDEYQASIPEQARSTAQCGNLKEDRRSLHVELAKAESSVLTQMRTGKISLAHFLHTMRVPEFFSAHCTCGWIRQDVKHVLLFCPELAEGRQELIDSAGIQDIRQMLSTKKGVKAAAKWLMQTGILQQYSLANEQLYGKRARRNSQL